MDWIINAKHYTIWENFSIELSREAVFSTGKVYHLSGSNGSGKSSFIRKILIPLLFQDREKQTALYIEQQVQSQFDAVKAYAVMQHPAIQINTYAEMVDYLADCLLSAYKKNSRPCVIIIDECHLLLKLLSRLSAIPSNQYCIIYASHQDCDSKILKDVTTLQFISKNAALSYLDIL